MFMVCVLIIAVLLTSHTHSVYSRKRTESRSQISVKIMMIRGEWQLLETASLSAKEELESPREGPD